MHDPTNSAHPPVKVIVIQAPQEAYDFEYYEQRLADSWLLQEAIAVRTLRMPFLAVPVGGSRRGGTYSVACICIALKVRDLLLSRAGFPHPRLSLSTDLDSPAVFVEWGEKPPSLGECGDEQALARFYGYSNAAIARYTARRTDAASTPESPCSVYPSGSPTAR